MYTGASRFAQELFRNDAEGLEWWSARIGNTPKAIELLYRADCMLNGARPGKVEAVPTTRNAEAQAQYNDIAKPGGSKYEAWQAGDKALDAERLRLARILHPGKASIG